MRGRTGESGWKRASISTNAFIISKDKKTYGVHGGGSGANTSDTSHERLCPCCWTGFIFSVSTLNVRGGVSWLGTRQWWKVTQWADGEGLVLFVQDNTQQQHTEMLQGAIDSTDGRISEIPRRYKHISNPNTEKSLCVCVFRKQIEEMRKQRGNIRSLIQFRIHLQFSR